MDDVIRDLREAITNGQVPLGVARRALEYLELWRSAVTPGKTFRDIKDEMRTK